jgi:hypothetical protein
MLGTTLATIAGAAATSAATAGGTMLASKFLGGKNKASGGSSGASFKPLNINAGGLKSSFSGDRFTVGSNATRSRTVGNIANAFRSQAGELRGLRARVAPGISELRSVRLNEIENARTRAIGDLRENLSARRVMGSSFASDALARAEAEFGKEKERVSAESFLQELEMTHTLIGEEFEATRNAFATHLSEMNVQADLATKLVSQASSQLGEATRLQMELAAKEAEGAGRFFGDTFKPVFDAIGAGVKEAVG